MIDRRRFETIKARHGGYASWAVWADPAATPKSNIGALSVLDPDANASPLGSLRDDVVLIGLNISRSSTEPFRNFHDSSPRANDFKLRYAFTGTPYAGAYMTDIIKHFEMVQSADVRKHLTPAFVRPHVGVFRTELADLGVANVTIIALGADAYKIVETYVPPAMYSRLVRITHYSQQISKEHYRAQVLEQLQTAPASTSPPNERFVIDE